MGLDCDTRVLTGPEGRDWESHVEVHTLHTVLVLQSPDHETIDWRRFLFPGQNGRLVKEWQEPDLQAAALTAFDLVQPALARGRQWGGHAGLGLVLEGFGHLDNLRHAAAELARGDHGVVTFRTLALGYRLGHMPELHEDGTLTCHVCGEITGPAPGVTEEQDGSLIWTCEGVRIQVPPVRWLPEVP
jgi:hypothetical protein